jgi:hypothetical protein
MATGIPQNPGGRGRWELASLRPMRRGQWELEYSDRKEEMGTGIHPLRRDVNWHPAFKKGWELASTFEEEMRTGYQPSRRDGNRHPPLKKRCELASTLQEEMGIGIHLSRRDGNWHPPLKKIRNLVITLKEEKELTTGELKASCTRREYGNWHHSDLNP